MTRHFSRPIGPARLLSFAKANRGVSVQDTGTFLNTIPGNQWLGVTKITTELKLGYIAYPETPDETLVVSDSKTEKVWGTFH